MNAIRRWWQQSAVGEYFRAQTPRDQAILVAVAALAVMAIYVVLLFRPARDWRDTNEARYERETELLTYMRANQRRLQAGGSPASSGGAQSLLTIVGDVARGQQMQLSRFQPESEGSVTVVMDDEEFDKIVRFVDVLEREHGLAMRQVTIDRKAEGRASARLVIQ